MKIQFPKLLTVLFFLFFSTIVLAGEGHDHGAAPISENTGGPKRLPDGTVFAPKPTQRQIGVRTTLVTKDDLSRAVELNASVVMDPNFGGKAQTIVAGRVTPGPQGFPLLGQKVQRGDILVYVVSEATQTNKSLAETRLQRLRQLTDTVPRKVIDEAEAAVANEEVRSPVTGFIASSNVVSGQVVDSRETLFEIVDPARLLIEALTFDLSIANDIAHAYIKVADQSIPLNLIGVGRVMRGQAVPIVFSLSSIPSTSLVIGQPVKVFAQNTQTVKAYRLPVTALMKNPANQNIVWIKKTPEQFEPRAVTVEPLDGANVAITSGLHDGELVVVRAATLINQIR